MITSIMAVNKDHNVKYAQRLSMLCIETSMLQLVCESNVDNMVITDFQFLCHRYEICYIQITALWQFQIRICNSSVTDLLLGSL